MAMQIRGTSPELTLIFDRSTFWLSGKHIKLLGETLSAVEGVESVSTQTVWYRKPRIRVVFNSETEPNTILRKMAKALRGQGDQHSNSGNLSDRDIPAVISSTTSVTDPVDSNRNWLVFSAIQSDLPLSRFRSAAYGALAMGSFAMSWIGLIVPGIPTIPFVLLTAHFALRSSPRLRERLLKSKMFGPIIRDWQQYGAIQRSVQIEAYVFTMVIIVVGFIFSPPIPILYVGMVIASALGLYAISQIPLIESPTKDRSIVPMNEMIMSPAMVVQN